MVIVYGISLPTVKYKDYPACGRYLTLFGKWQQRCGLSLPVLQLLVNDTNVIDNIALVVTFS